LFSDLVALQVLHLKNNFITHIQPRVFDSLGSLHSLFVELISRDLLSPDRDLSGNLITALPAMVCPVCSVLNDLFGRQYACVSSLAPCRSLQGNPVARIASNAFNGIDSLALMFAIICFACFAPQRSSDCGNLTQSPFCTGTMLIV
jgi:hypothetical protein